MVTTVAPDGSLVTTYTTRTTTVHEEPTRVTKQYIMRSSESSSPRPGDTSTSLNYETQSYNSSVAAHDYQVSSTLPRESPRTEYPKAVGSSTMPRDGYRPIATSTPEVFEEERINPDG